MQPGENIAVFNDALSTLQNSSSFLYSDGQGNRYWYDTRPTLRKVMEDRAQQIAADDARYEVERQYKNTLVFAACDGSSTAGLVQAARMYLAWKSISDDRELLNLDMSQARETDRNVARAVEMLKVRIQEAYSWLLAPTVNLDSGSLDVTWSESRIAGGAGSGRRTADDLAGFNVGDGGAVGQGSRGLAVELANAEQLRFRRRSP